MRQTGLICIVEDDLELLLLLPLLLVLYVVWDSLWLCAC